jgi:hypothetical protein
MKINGIDMEKACNIAFNTYYEEIFAYKDEAQNPIDKAVKEAIFAEGFSAALKVIIGTAKKE